MSVSYIVGISGASGVKLGVKLVQELSKCGVGVYVVVSEEAKLVARYEYDGDIVEDVKKHSKGTFGEYELDAPISSTSYPVNGMVIMPCSMSTVAKLCHGITDNLLVRAADNQIRMKNKLILVPREAPLNQVHLRNLYRLSRIENVYVMFPVLTYYHKPRSIEDVENFVIGKVLDIIGVKHNLYKRWGLGT